MQRREVCIKREGSPAAVAPPQTNVIVLAFQRPHARTGGGGVYLYHRTSTLPILKCLLPSPPGRFPSKVGEKDISAGKTLKKDLENHLQNIALIPMSAIEFDCP